MPVEAVFYDASTPAKLADSQKFQRECYLQTYLYVPIVKMDIAAADKEILSFDAKDQRFVQRVAERLNVRYNNLSNNCSGAIRLQARAHFEPPAGERPQHKVVVPGWPVPSICSKIISI